MTFIRDVDTLYTCRSPYHLYRPYQLEIQRTTIPNNSAVLHRTPNLDILSEINRRSRRLERIVSYQKILTVIQMLLSLHLIIMEMTKILLIREHFNNWEQKFVLICEMFQPILFATIAFIHFIAFCDQQKVSHKSLSHHLSQH
ncbi:unnamed protein product [Brugia pahangi]|uniref:Uncharacterized protein n=1 Tax=Brugia pahangi TaxID=6280 RepID=A0A0N4TZ08_BRUPA|nr:unnamed protein product [Brugia pahangi]